MKRFSGKKIVRGKDQEKKIEIIEINKLFKEEKEVNNHNHLQNHHHLHHRLHQIHNQILLLFLRRK